MDLHQTLINNNSSRSTANTGAVLLPPNNNLTVTAAVTTNTISTAPTPDTTPTAVAASPSPSPTAALVNHQHNHHHHHQHRNTQNIVTQKTNQVSTVLLYNIPIVSLYIEGQERLCLAQISNTLLKHFSYNEIHNRRVALGITCVQCTPVQLEILRRAGAMPVSSRRCGMITRREAERLCKSFLGDNTPPRLPEDFAFNVQHKCSWGCRGSFLPSRYNSSRAKCIKCHYCGMFFSPNKFIFHSHRIGPGDKYVQPDAANFNSWRRHMMLSGQPPQEVMYAWEDVKAMFNGGTRKRLMISHSSSSPLPRVNSSSPSSCSAGASSSSMSRDQSLDDVNGDALLSNIPKNGNSVNTVTAAAAVVGVTAVAVGSSVRPLNLHFQASTAAGLATESSYAVGGDMHLIPAAALSRSFMMDYMWQHAHQAAKNTYNQQYQQQQQPHSKVKSNNSAFTLPWINATLGSTSDIQTPENHHANLTYSSSVNSNWANSAAANITRNFSQIINTSAFKPVVQHQKKLTEMPSVIAKSRRRHTTLQISPHAHGAGRKAQNKISNSFSSDEDEHEEEQNNNSDVQRLSPSRDDKQPAADNNEINDDDILVDIETTEDEKPNTYSTNTTLLSTCSRHSFNNDETEHRDEVENNDKQTASDEDVIDVVHNDNEDTVPEYSPSLTPLAIIKNTTESERKLSVPSAFTSPTVTQKGFRELSKLYSLDHSNTENVPPPAQSISPKSNSSSSCSRSSECFYIKGTKTNYETDVSTNANLRNMSRSPEVYEDQKLHLYNTNQEKSNKGNRKRSCEKFNQANEGIFINNDNSDDDARSDSGKKLSKKSVEPIAKEVQLIEALSHKYELTYYNSNTSCKNSYVVNNNNNNNPISNNNFYNDNNNNEFWQMARLCMQRPINCEQNQKQQNSNQQQPQLTRLPTFYYRQQQLHASPAEQHQQPNSQTTALMPATQQVYLQLQQHQQSVQKFQHSYSNETIQTPTSISSNHIPIVYIPESADISTSSSFSTAYNNNVQQNDQDTLNKANGANGIG